MHSNDLPKNLALISTRRTRVLLLTEAGIDRVTA